MNFIKIIITVFGILFLVTGCADEPVPGEISASVSNYLSLMPEQTHFLIYANFEDIKHTPFGDKLRMEMERKIVEEEEDEDYLEFVAETGLDIKKDIYEIWIGGLHQKEFETDKNGGAIIRGKYNQKRIIEYMKKEHYRQVQEEVYKGHKIYTSHKRRHGEFSCAFLNSETLLLGADFWIKKVIDQSKNGGLNVLNNQTMAKFIRNIPYKNHLWGIFDLNEVTEEWAEEIRKRGSDFKGTKSLENMQSLIFYTDFTQKAKLFIKGNFTTEEEAQLVEDMLTGFRAMAKLMVSDDKEAIDMLNGIKIKTYGSELNISTKVDKNFIEKLEQKSNSFRERKLELL